MSAAGDYNYFSMTKTSTAAAGQVARAQHLVFEVSGAHQNILTSDLENFCISLIRTRLPLHTCPAIVQPSDASVNRWRIGFSLSASDDQLVDPPAPDAASPRLFMADVPFISSFGPDGGSDIGAVPRAYYSLATLIGAINRALAAAWTAATANADFVTNTFLDVYGAGAGQRVLNNPPFLRLVEGSSSLSLLIPRYDLANTNPPPANPEVTLAWYSISPSGAQLDAIGAAWGIAPERRRHNINIVFSESLANTVFAQFAFQRFQQAYVRSPAANPAGAPLCRLAANMNEDSIVLLSDIVSATGNQIAYYNVVSDSPNLQNISSLVKIYLTITGLSVVNDSVADVSQDTRAVGGVPVLTDIAVALDPQIGRSAVYLSPAAQVRQINIRDGVRNLRDIRIAAYYQIFTPDSGIVSYPLLLPANQFAEIRLAFTRKFSKDFLQYDESPIA